MTATRPPFHLAFPIADLEATRRFYVERLGCRQGRESETWIDFDFFGHQISAHLKPEECRSVAQGQVDGEAVPLRHFGAILAWNDFHVLARRLKAAGQTFIIEPHLRFQGEPGEQATMFLADPSGNALEFKAFQDEQQIFAS
jgi:extradiol dioxygenase family protein